MFFGVHLKSPIRSELRLFVDLKVFAIHLTTIGSTVVDEKTDPFVMTSTVTTTTLRFQRNVDVVCPDVVYVGIPDC